MRDVQHRCRPRARVHGTRPRIRLAALGAVVVVLLASCAAGANTAAAAEGAGFWLGLWHGLISPVTIIVSLFSDTVSIYEIENNGAWYDVGFMIGVSAFFSGAGRSGCGRRS